MTSSGLSSAMTRGIRVTVVPRYLPEQSRPKANKFVFAYAVRIENDGDVAVQLVSRHWIITDGMGAEQQVRGDGVVGQQPLIKPGTYHEYSSFCPLPTPVGTMRGTYRMVAADGSEFDAQIPSFTLSVPGALN